MIIVPKIKTKEILCNYHNRTKPKLSEFCKIVVLQDHMSPVFCLPQQDANIPNQTDPSSKLAVTKLKYFLQRIILKVVACRGGTTPTVIRLVPPCSGNKLAVLFYLFLCIFIFNCQFLIGKADGDL